MTTEGPTGSSPATHPSQDVTANGAAAPPDDPDELRQEIERTREQLGETVEALVAKTDVKARAQEKVNQLTGRLKSKAGQAKQQAAAQTGRVQRQLGEKTTVPWQKVAAVSGPAADQVRQQTAAAAAKISKATPLPVQRVASQAAATARQRRVPLAVTATAVGAGVLVWLVIGRRRRR